MSVMKMPIIMGGMEVQRMGADGIYETVLKRVLTDILKIPTRFVVAKRDMKEWCARNSAGTS